jgi:hypothetical protein
LLNVGVEEFVSPDDQIANVIVEHFSRCSFDRFLGQPHYSPCHGEVEVITQIGHGF